MPPLPAVKWHAIGNAPPKLLEVNYQGPNAPLPKADAVVITWTNAEWSAFDHVFCNSTAPRPSQDNTWQNEWLAYTKGAPSPPANGKDFHLWGYFRMVEIAARNGQTLRVLLFKAQAHLAYDPYLTGLVAMTKGILQDTGAAYLYSIGTAGGAGDSDLLGNSVVTNGGHLMMTNSNNQGSPLNNQTFLCKGWFPCLDLLGPVEKHLLFPLDKVASWPEYELLYQQLSSKMGSTVMNGVSVKDLVNPPLDPANLRHARTIDCKDKPLLTTDFYYIAQPGDAAKYCILEMDDAVLGATAGELGANYAFVRNVSDPVVPSKTKAGLQIPDPVRNEWSSLIYDTFGFYTSYNGALSAWATIAGL
jgi:hypothetical protein